DLFYTDNNLHAAKFGAYLSMRKIAEPNLCQRPLNRAVGPEARAEAYSWSMRILLLVNGAASTVTARTRVVIRKALKTEHDVELAETGRRGHATSLARGAAHDGVEVIVVLGGDGTVNETANGLAGTSCAMAVLPGGSTNVFSRILGLPDDPVDATSVILDALREQSIRRIGLGMLNGRYFTFHTGLGYDAAVVEQVERHGSLKRYAGHPLFIWAALATWFGHYDRRSPRMRLQFSNGDVVDDSKFTIVLNADPYTYLGSRALHLVPECGLNDALASVSFKKLRMSTLLGPLSNAIRSGTGIPNSRQIHVASGLQRIDITTSMPVPYQVDGDFLGEVSNVVIEHHPEVLDLVWPSTASQ
ncbi:MAG: diacylglycerol kinase family protein, partial [Acidimicrobiales bacterium]